MTYHIAQLSLGERGLPFEQAAKKEENTMKNIRAIVARDGRLLWAGDDIGARGGRTTWYAERREGATEPGGWELWGATQREAGGSLAPAGTFGGPMGLGH